MAGACSCKTGLNPLKSRWQGHVAVRVVALEACGEFGGFEAGQTAGACRWLGHVADRGVQGHVAVRVVALMACALLATREPSSTPPVVPGAAPALAKAGVGGHLPRMQRECGQ